MKKCKYATIEQLGRKWFVYLSDIRIRMNSLRHDYRFSTNSNEEAVKCAWNHARSVNIKTRKTYETLER